jgi:fibronectin type 3 domain-containing protein
MNFGNVAVGGSASLNGNLSASTSDVTVSSAAWNGSGYSVSGITFPVTVAAGQSANYTVTFTPPASGSSAGSITFTSNATDPSLQQTFNGSGAQSSTHTVALSWSPSTSTVSGYNLYRGTQTGGPYSTKVNSSLIAGTSFTDSSLLSGTTYYYVSTAVDSNNVESAYSNEASAAIP